MRVLAAWICSLAVFLASSRAADVLPNAFMKAEAEAVKAFLDRNMRQTNAAIVVGLIDENGIQVFSARTLEEFSAL